MKQDTKPPVLIPMLPLALSALFFVLALHCRGSERVVSLALSVIDLAGALVYVKLQELRNKQ